ESNPEIAIPAIVAYRGYEIARDIKSIYDATQSTPSETTGLRRRFPQPFYRGSALPTPTHFQNPTPRGGSFDPSLTTTTTTTTYNNFFNRGYLYCTKRHRRKN